MPCPSTIRNHKIIATTNAATKRPLKSILEISMESGNGILPRGGNPNTAGSSVFLIDELIQLGNRDTFPV